MSDTTLTVLLVEDNPVDAQFIQYTLREITWLPVQVVTATTLAQAFSTLARQSVDLILLDLMLPDSVDRRTFQKLLRVTDLIPVVVLSGINDREVALDAIKEGAQDYLVKGEIDAKLLERTIRYAVERGKLLNVQKITRQEIQAQDQLLKLMAGISATFINLSSEQIDHAIEQALHSMGDFLQSDLAFIFEFSESMPEIQHYYEWSASTQRTGGKLVHRLMQAVPDWVLGELQEKDLIYWQEIGGVPPEAEEFKAMLQQQEIMSFMLVPLFYKKKIIAIMGLATVNRVGSWSSATTSLLSTTGEVFYRAIKKKQSEEQLRESEKQYRTLVENMDEGLIYVDLNGEIQFANQSMCRMLNYGQDEILGKNFTKDICYDDNPNGVLGMIQSRLSEQHEIPIRKKNGQKVWVIINNHPLINEKGKKIGTMGTLVNITDRKKTEEKLKQVNEELKTFIYRTSHDLRGPLASVLGITNLASMEITDARALKYFEYVDRSTQKLDRTLKALIDVASITQPDEGYTQVQFEELVREVIDNLNYTNRLENLHIDLEVRQKNAFISSKQLLTYVFEKLIENAVAYRKEDISNPKLAIRIDVEGPEAAVVVEDNGTGIPKELHRKVFNMFFKGVEKSRGSGLGLYVVEKLVSSLNGTIELSSQVGLGTRFDIHLRSL